MIASSAQDALLAPLPLEQQALARDPNPAVAVPVMLAQVAEIPPLFYGVSKRSRWLALITDRLRASAEPQPALELSLLCEVAQTMFAARQIAAAQTALDQAIEQARSLAQWQVLAICLARKVVHSMVEHRSDAMTALKALEQLIQSRSDVLTNAVVVAELNLARAAVAASVQHWQLCRQALADMARSGLAHDGRLHYFALASHELLAQCAMRSGQRVDAFQRLQDAAELSAGLQAWAECSNHHAILAAYGVRTGSFDSAMLHAEQSIDCLKRSAVTHPRRSPWLGAHFDLAAEQDFAGVVRNLAEAVNETLDRGDRQGYLVAICAMVAFYLVADRAAEGLDTLNEAIVAVEELPDPAGAALLRSVSENLLRFMGLLH
ncbi:MAG TPA: hypothetical protein DCQ06_08635 [Myxococcales bacterium]|nr:hypothetical protein [Myxococcales bacterium]HAN31647.1 hypothetical protein [Myxococcales bacterium]